MDIPLSEAMICWDRESGTAGVVPHPDSRGLSGKFATSAGACFTNWRKKSDKDRRLGLMIEAWHAVTFSNIPTTAMHEALLVIPEYRDMLADDCLPHAYRHERDN